MRFRRLIAATLVCASVVLGISFLIASGQAASASTANGPHTCSAADKQFLQTAQSNITQLSYWSDSLISGDVSPAIVIKQAKSEAKQVSVTGPTDPSLRSARSLLWRMFIEYGAAVRAKTLGNSPAAHVRAAYTYANYVHDLLVGAQPGLADKGCDVTPLLKS